MNQDPCVLLVSQRSPNKVVRFRLFTPVFIQAFTTLLLVVAMSGCGGHAASITLNPMGPIHVDKQISAGQAVQFSNLTQGDVTICLGDNGRCIANAQGPSELQPPGLKISQGQSQDITFANSGRYEIVSLNNANVHVYIDVR